ncbi:hypothetical protein RV02_GL003142 [Enterococcus gilvus]|jgi:CxxC motif-containing protein|nr:hypothetical protein RV02_GL003142 [Enterococcus gilvus]
MKEINNVQLKAPVQIGDIAIENLLGTGVDVIVTSEVQAS